MKYTKTEMGQKAFRERSPQFSAKQRSAFILFDGDKSGEEVLASTTGMGLTQSDIDHLEAQGFLAAVKNSAASRSGREKLDIPTKQARYALAMPIAARLTASLGLRGFRLNLAVEAASGFEDLLALLPKIQEAVGADACRPLALVLKKPGSGDSGFTQR